MSGDAIAVEVSQDQLYFLVPFTNTLVENVVEITSKMKDPRDTITFKVLSTVQHRYGLSDPVGILAPGATCTLRITLEPPTPTNNTVPEKGTTDYMYMDFAVVPPDVQLRHSDDAVKFWKQRGPVKHGSVPLVPSASGGTFVQHPTAHTNANSAVCQRVKIPCLFVNREELPGYLQLRQVSPSQGVKSLNRRGGGAPRSPRCVKVRTPQEELLEAKTSARNATPESRDLQRKLHHQKQKDPLWKRVWELKVPVSIAALFVFAALLLSFLEFTPSSSKGSLEGEAMQLN